MERMGPLETYVILGVADNWMVPSSEPALECKVPEDSDMKGKWGPRHKDSVELESFNLIQMEQFKKVLKYI